MEVGATIVSLAVDAVAAGLLALALVGLCRRYTADTLEWWAMGWMAGAVASAGSAASLLLLGSPVAGLRAGVGGLVVLAGLMQAGLQYEGAAVLGGQPTRRAVRRLLGATALVYSVSAVAVPTVLGDTGLRVALRVSLPFSALGVSFLASGWIVWRAAHGGGLGRRMLPVALALYGVQKAASALVSAQVVTLPLDLILFTELLSLAVLAFALPLWFLEEERAGLLQAQARERELQRQLEHSQRLEALGELAAGVAHDFNNLLTVVGLHANLIRDEPARTAEVRESASEIDLAQQRGRSLVSRLLTFARASPGEASRHDLCGLVDRLRGLLDPLIGDSVVLRIQHASLEIPVLMNREQFEQILVNLVVNARDAMVPGGGTIVVETGIAHGEQDTRWAVLRVHDTGSGIPAGLEDRIFEPFFTTKVRDRGTGLGLAIVYGIVRDAGGRISVENAPGSGAVFTVLLPLAE